MLIQGGFDGRGVNELEPNRGGARVSNKNIIRADSVYNPLSEPRVRYITEQQSWLELEANPNSKYILDLCLRIIKARCRAGRSKHWD